MKKALLVSTVIGFMASFERSDIALLQELGYEVHLACNCKVYGDNEQFAELKKLNAVMHDIPFSRSLFSKKHIESYKELDKLMKEERFNIVHCHTAVGSALGRMAAHKNNVPVIMYTAHGFHFCKGGPVLNRIVFYPIEKHLSRFTDILVTINNEDYELAKKKLQAKIIKRIHGVGIEIERFGNGVSKSRDEKRKELGIKSGEILLFSVGELDKYKNHRVVLEAMKILASRGYKYIIAGEGVLRTSHEQYIKDNNLEGSIQLLGFRTDIAELLKAADIYVFPSTMEGLSVALMEAVASKKLIVCSEIRGNVDTVITKESYFSPHSVKELTVKIEAINQLTEDEKNRLVEENYNNLKKYRLSEVRKEMKAIYKIADVKIKKERN